MPPPKTEYTRSGEASIAYQVFGEGATDLVLTPQFVSNLDFNWADPGISGWLRALASFARVVTFDRRGMGLSDPVAGAPSIEERVADTLAVINAAGCERPVLFGISEGGSSSMALAAAHPNRVAALVLYGSYPKLLPDESYLPQMAEWSAERIRMADRALERWGEAGWAELWLGEEGITITDADRRAFGAFERATASPAMAQAAMEAVIRLDVRGVLSAINVPTLILHRVNDPLHPIEHARYLAEHIRGARLVELEGRAYAPWLGDMERIVEELREFVTGTRVATTAERSLATILFTDIAASTERAAELGDRRWRELLEAHDRACREEAERFGGRVVKSLGDGLLALFDGPVAGIRCARAMQGAVHGLGISLRAGLHTGECEAIGDDVGGIAVHLAARVGAQAAPGEVLVSETIRGLVVGSGIELADRGQHELKGVPGSWRLYGVVDGGSPSVARLPSPRETMRPGDRAAVAVARRAPSVLRALGRRRMRRWQTR